MALNHVSRAILSPALQGTATMGTKLVSLIVQTTALLARPMNLVVTVQQTDQRFASKGRRSLAPLPADTQELKHA